MIVAYVSQADMECYNKFVDEFEDVRNFANINEFINFYATNNNRDIVLIYRVESINELQILTSMHFKNNIYIIVIGKDDIEFSLQAGKIGVDAYINDSSPSKVVDIHRLVIDSRLVIKHRKGKSNISVFTGISGGIGTTTIAMNTARCLADEYQDKNVLFLDFAYTKAISNLFFNIINPEKYIIDIATMPNLEVEELFNSGLYKISNNLFVVPGIQKHTDREDLDKHENIQKFLNFINFIKEKFDFIIIDIGVFEDVELEVDIQEMADEIFVIAEFSIPSMSILKTYIDIIDKSGWYNKTRIIANRVDSFGTITQEDAKKILSRGLKHQFEIDFSLPNDAAHCRECWNEAKLIYDLYPNAPLSQQLLLLTRQFFTYHQHFEDNKKMVLKKPDNFLSRLKQWL